tara:strand:+ start:466 stop:807 length:342 start_codon:yes stop_codon:yes gene_type:complete
MAIDKRYNIAVYLEKPFNRDTVKVTADYDGNLTIVEWNESKSQPTKEQLDALDSEATKLENNDKAIVNRLKEYPSVGDMIDAICKKEAGDSTEFDSLETKRQATKSKYLKESS